MTLHDRTAAGNPAHAVDLIRDRKLYVVPTPFHLVEGVTHRQTLILAADVTPGAGFFEVGALRRREATEFIVGYSFDLRTNDLVPTKVPNPGAGTEHLFRAWRLNGSAADRVSMRNIPSDSLVTESDGVTTED